MFIYLHCSFDDLHWKKSWRDTNASFL